MFLQNIWNNITEWFQDRSERGKLLRSFNESARNAFVLGIAPTMLKASMSKGKREYRHQFSAWFNTGFRIQALTGRNLSKKEMTFIGQTVLHDEQLVRQLISLGWDTLEIHDDTGIYGCRWKLMDYANLGGLIE